MKNRSRITPYLPAIISIILVLSYGCKDEFYDVNVGDRITPDQHYQSLIDANVSLQGAIIPLQDAMPKLIMLDGLRSDMMEVTPNADSYLKDIHYQMISASNPLADPSDLYKVIVNVNEVLANIDGIAEKDKDYDALTAYTYKGALIGMRAWTYLTLVRLYNKAVYIDDNLTSLPENLTQNVLSKEVILDTLINQLETYFESEYTTTKYTELRIPHYVNNKALLGELYLEVGRFSEAATYLKLACESYGNQTAMLKVDRTYQNAAWGAIFLNAESNNIENISAIPYSRAEAQFNPLADWVGYNYQYLVKPSTILVDSFIAQVDAAGMQGDLYRGSFTIGAEITEWTSDTTYNYEAYITKYAVDPTDPSSSDIIISRAADIHLMLAEAYNRIGDEKSQKYALTLLNQGFNKENPKPAEFARWANNLGIRGRAYLKSRVVPDSLSTDSVTLVIEDMIIAERALELAFEGKRWFDLVRIAERRNDPAFLADKVAAKFAGTSQYEAIRNKLMNPANWYLPFE
ncbi:MAG TPA: RagB/SusD family nutrient uptake outer membrane protein [Draconibacterium sp.]|nr:RagB/SusD family nutrient uptake outer membrane protein [Draconibacterium sp.]